MVKLSLPGLIRWCGLTMNLEQIAEFLENPNLLENLPPSEDRALKLNGLFYFLEYQVPDEESLAFTQFFLTENPDSVYKNYFINFLLHKTCHEV